mgnify:CR=1 FL=1
MINKLLFFNFKINNPTNIIHMDRLNYYLCYNPDWKSGVIVKDDPEELTSKLVGKIPSTSMEDLVKDLFKRKDCKQVIIQNVELKFNYNVSYVVVYKFKDKDEIYPCKLSMEVDEDLYKTDSEIYNFINDKLSEIHRKTDYVTQLNAVFYFQNLEFSKIK